MYLSEARSRLYRRRRLRFGARFAAVFYTCYWLLHTLHSSNKKSVCKDLVSYFLFSICFKLLQSVQRLILQKTNCIRVFEASSIFRSFHFYFSGMSRNFAETAKIFFGIPEIYEKIGKFPKFHVGRYVWSKFDPAPAWGCKFVPTFPRDALPQNKKYFAFRQEVRRRRMRSTTRGLQLDTTRWNY